MDLTELLIRVDLPLYALLILAFLSLYLHVSSPVQNFSSRLFKSIVDSLLIISLLETSAWIIRYSGSGLINLQKAIMGVNIAFSSLPTVLWMAYIDFKIFRSRRDLRKRLPLYFIPTALIATIMAYSLFNRGFVFHIDDMNQFVSGPGINLPPLIVYGAIICYLAFLFTNRRKITGKIIYTMLLFLILPLLGSLVQIFLPQLSLNWASYTVAILFCFILLEITGLTRDDLTGLPPRGQLEERLSQKCRNGDRFSLIMIDLNFFKEINDRLGHMIGDEVLKKTAAVLLSCTNPEDMVCRFGGDEFVLLLESDNPELSRLLVERIESRLTGLNSHESRYDISLSYGCEFIEGPHREPSEVIALTDNRMYEDKARRKAAKQG